MSDDKPYTLAELIAFANSFTDNFVGRDKDATTMRRILYSAESQHVWSRGVHEFAHSTPSIRRYLALTSLPFIVGLGAKAKPSELWDVSLEPNQEDGTHELLPIMAMPTGSLRPTYMFISESPLACTQRERAVLKRFLGEGVQRGYFHRTACLGAFSYCLRGAVAELQLQDESWYSSLVKLLPPSPMRGGHGRQITVDEAAAHKHLIEREIELLEPEIVVFVGEHTYEVAYSLGLPKFCRKHKSKVKTAWHPLTSVYDKTPVLTYSNHLWSMLGL